MDTQDTPQDVAQASVDAADAQPTPLLSDAAAVDDAGSGFDWSIETRRKVALVIAGAAIVLDLVSKLWAEATLTARTIEVIPGLLEFDYTENPGSAFSLFQNAGPLLGIGAVIAAVVIWFSLRSATSSTEIVGLGLILGGALGNLIDRVRRADSFLDGAVVDFIELPNWPTFNIADSAITIGVVLLLWGALRSSD